MSDLILAVETSAAWTGVALARGRELLAHRTEESTARHNEVLAVMIKEVVQGRGKSFDDISLIGLSIGPGSFTALRIGLLVAKGIAFCRGIKIVPVMTLDVLNASLEIGGPDQFRLPLIDAYKGEVFTAFYEGTERKSEPMICDPACISGMVDGRIQNKPVTVFGPAVRKYENSLRASLRNRMALPQEPEIAPSAAALVRLAWERRSQAVDPAELEPFYLRKPDARKPTG